MPRRRVSRDLKARIPILYHQHGLSVKDIRHVLGVGKTLVYDTLEYDRLYGVPYNIHARHPGQPHKLDSSDVEFILNLLTHRRTLYLDEIQTQLLNCCGIWVSTTTILRTTRRLYFSHKCVSTKAEEANDLQHSHYMVRIAEIVPNPDMLMFTDKASRNRRTHQQRYGWAIKGNRCINASSYIFLHILPT
ncbi:hypothetical protein K435DRAFT_823898 [Dendrothele bispora CBS 962.96]|uniref:Uncharacterized protein n=1 Tax=Dendrothele bispora (strain CBS 962.96) TaxID=1314807 RepID=A0A4V6T4Y5_DENBC|nr:hypothetical protein K435DRAFT_823898 [Dendrothele bispora CBS 962.96]